MVGKLVVHASPLSRLRADEGVVNVAVNYSAHTSDARCEDDLETLSCSERRLQGSLRAATQVTLNDTAIWRTKQRRRMVHVLDADNTEKDDSSRIEEQAEPLQRHSQ